MNENIVMDQQNSENTFKEGLKYANDNIEKGHELTQFFTKNRNEYENSKNEERLPERRPTPQLLTKFGARKYGLKTSSRNPLPGGNNSKNEQIINKKNLAKNTEKLKSGN